MILVNVKNTATQEVTNMGQFKTSAEADQWISSCTERGDFGQSGTFEITKTDISGVIAQVEINTAARKYLSSTDWYVTRFVETGVPVPADVAAARAQARSRVVSVDENVFN